MRILLMIVIMLIAAINLYVTCLVYEKDNKPVIQNFATTHVRERITVIEQCTKVVGKAKSIKVECDK